MALREWLAKSQSGRIAAAMAISLIFVCVLFSGFLAEIAAKPEWNPMNITILCSVATFVTLLFLGIHLGLCGWSLDRHKIHRIQFGMQRLLVCTFLSSLLLLVNFFENPYSPFRLFEFDTFSKSDPKIFGFPFEVLRIPFGGNQTPIINPEGVVMNALFLVLFAANILALKVKASETKQD